MKKMYSRFLALVMALAMIFSCTSVAFATEVPTEVSTTRIDSISFVPLDETNYSTEDALAVLGLSEEDVNGKAIYAVSMDVSNTSTPQSRKSNVQVPSGSSHVFPAFSFTSSHTGDTTWTVGGSAFTWGGVLNSISDPNAMVTVNVIRNDTGKALQNDYIQFTEVGKGIQGKKWWVRDAGTNCFYFKYTTVSGVTAKLTMFVVTDG